MKKMTRVLSWLLCFVMIVGLLPMAALQVHAANSDPYIGVLVTGNGYTKRGSEYELNFTEKKLIKEGSGAFSSSGYSALCTDANCETKLDEDPRLGRTYYFRIYFAYYNDRTYALTDANSTIEIGGFSNGKLVSFQHNGAYLEVVCSVKYGEEISRVNAVGTGYGYDSDRGGYAPIFSTLEAYTSDGKKVEQEDFVWHYTFYTSASFNPDVKLTTEPVNGETYYFAIYVDMYDDGISYDYDLDSIIENSTVTLPGFDVEYYRFMEREMGSYMEIAYTAAIRQPKVWVGGVGMYDGDYLAVGATETTDRQPSGGYAHYSDGILTLKDYSYEGEGYKYSNHFSACVYSKQALTIRLEGDSVLKQTKDQCESVYVMEAGLTIEGLGSLTCTDGYAIMANNDIVINGGSITSTGPRTRFGLRSNEGSVIINGGSIMAEGSNQAVYHSASGSFTFAEELTVLASTAVDGELGEYVAANHNNYKKIVVLPAPEVYVGGVGMCDGDYLAVGAIATTKTQPSGGYAYYKNGTLTLNNYSYEGKGYAYDYALYATIYAQRDLTIQLHGTNTLKQTAVNSESIYIEDGTLTIRESGSLAISDDGYGIYAEKTITVESGSITGAGRINGLRSKNGDIIINGGTVTASSQTTLRAVNGSVKINGGTVTVTGSVQAIYFGDTGSFTVAEGLRIQASTTVDGALGEYVAENHDSYKKIVVQSAPEVYVGGVGMYDGDYLAVGATATTKTQPSGGYAYYKDGKLTLKNYSFYGGGYRYAQLRGYYAVIYATRDLTVELTGKNTLTQTYSSSEVFNVANSSLTIGGDGSLNAQSEDASILVTKDIVINSGVILSAGESYGFRSTTGKVIINGGSVTAEGSTQAIYFGSSGSFTVAEGLTVQASTTVDGALGAYVAENHDNYKKIVVQSAPKVYVGGVGMYDGDYLAVGATATTGTQPSGGYAYYKDGKLTLKNYSYEGKGYEYNPSKEYFAIIYANRALTVELLGTNTLEQTEQSSEAIYIAGNGLTLGGTGSLEAIASYGITADKTVTVNGGTIISNNTHNGIMSYDQDVIINGGTVTASGWYGLRASGGSVKINGGNVTATGSTYAIYYAVYDGFTVAEGLRIRASTTVDGALGEYVAANHNSYKKIVVQSAPQIYVGGVGMYDGDYLAVGATATTKTKPADNYAYYENGKLTLKNYTYEGEGYMYDLDDAYYATVYTERDLTLELEGTNTLKQTAWDSDTIYVNSGSLTIQGDGSLTYSDNGYGIFADKTITVNGGSITTNDGKYNGLRSNSGDIIINGGNVTAFAVIALRASNGSVKINGGNVTATGSDRAIYFGSSGSFTVAEGLYIQASTTEDGALGAYVAENHDSYMKIVVSETPIIQDPEAVTWVSASTTLGGNIGLNFYVELADFLVNDPSTYMHFTFADQVVSVPLSQAVKSTGSNGKTQYKFTCPVNAKNMADAVCAQVMTDGGAVGMPKSLAVVTYCNFMIQYSNDANLVSLMKSMLNYGASAQLLFNHNTGNLANAGLSEADKTLPVIDASAYAASVSGSEEGIILASATLSLETETTIRIYFSLTGSKPIDQYSFYVNGNQVTPQQKGGQYFIEITDIAAQDLDAMHTITVGGLTVKYAGLSYVATVLKNPDIAGEILVNTAKALFVYNDKAETYFNS